MDCVFERQRFLCRDSQREAEQHQRRYFHGSYRGRCSFSAGVTPCHLFAWHASRTKKGPARYNHSLERAAETELARRLIAGEPEAFDRFVEHFRTKIYHYSWLMCGQREDAEEVAQETLLKVFENFDRLQEPERVRPWVFQIARNACLMKRRKSVFAPAHELSLEQFLPAADHSGGHRKLEIADWSGLPDRHMLQTELKQVLDLAIRALPENYRPVILMRDVEELSTAETAQVTGLDRRCREDPVAPGAPGRPPATG